jgi:hypothetical protein
MSRTSLLWATALLAAVGLLAAPQWCQSADENKPAADATNSATEVDKPSVGAKCPVPATVKPPSVTSWGTVLPIEQAIEEALDSPAEVEFLETPLPDAMGWLESQHHIQIEIDTRALEDVGLVSTDLLITKSLKDISLRSALNLMLRGHDLTYAIQDEVLLITTPEEAETRLTTRVYPVGDLLVPQCKSAQFSGGGDMLIDVITTTLAPATWGEVGGAGSIAGASFGNVPALVISQTQDVHREIASLLKLLRTAAAEGPKSASVQSTTEDADAAPPENLHSGGYL